MKASQDIIKEKNYVLHEIKEIKGKPNILPENIEIIEDLTKIHEIKEIKNIQKIPKIIKRNNNNIIDIKLEGEPAEIRKEENSCEENLAKEELCHDGQNNEILCNGYRKKYENENIDINNGEGQVQFGFVDAPFLERNKEEVIVNESLTDLIETIFARLSTDDVLNDAHHLKFNFNVLNENDKNEVIEGIRIKIDNEEQENRFNDLLKLLL